jgi:hypothetical protein
VASKPREDVRLILATARIRVVPITPEDADEALVAFAR